MESLRILMIKNQSLLAKLRARSRYCLVAMRAVESDTHKQFGPFAGYWDEWLIEAEEMQADILVNTENTSLFLLELLDFVVTLESKKRLTKSDKSYLLEVTSLTEDRLREQAELLSSINERIAIHKDLTEQLRLVEAIDGLDE